MGLIKFCTESAALILTKSLRGAATPFSSEFCQFQEASLGTFIRFIGYLMFKWQKFMVLILLLALLRLVIGRVVLGYGLYRCGGT